MRALLCCREQAEATANVIQADSHNAAPAVTRRTTADIATQYMLGDLDSEPVIAHAHELHKAHAAANTHGFIHNSNVESAGLLGSASAAQHRHTPHELIQAQDYPNRGGVDGPSWQAESGMLTKHALSVVHCSELEGTITAAEDEAAQKQALLGIDPPHAASWYDARPVKQHQQAMASQAKHGASTDDVSVSVTAEAHECMPAHNPGSWTDMHHGRASSRHAGPGGTGAPRGAVMTAGSQSPYAVRLPLHSIHEEHGIRAGSTSVSSSGRHHLDY